MADPYLVWNMLFDENNTVSLYATFYCLRNEIYPDDHLKYIIENYAKSGEEYKIRMRLIKRYAI